MGTWEGVHRVEEGPEEEIAALVATRLSREVAPMARADCVQRRLVARRPKGSRAAAGAAENGGSLSVKVRSSTRRRVHEGGFRGERP